MVTIRRYNKFIKEVKELEDNNYTVLRLPSKEEIEQDSTKNIKVLIRHNCEYCNNNKYFIKPEKFVNGRRCPVCSKIKTNKKNTKSHEDFVKKVKELVGDEYLVKGQYEKSHNKIELYHTKCNQSYFVTAT